MKKLLALCLLLSTNFIFAAQLSFEQKMDDFNELTAIIKAGYGPLVYKKETQGIDIEKLIPKYTKLIKETKNNSEFYYTIIKFVAEFNDSHFGARIPTDHKSRLGFETDLVQGKVLIDTIDRKKLKEEDFPFKKGDEILTLGDQTIEQVLNELIPFMGQGTKLTAKRKAAMLVSNRFGTISPVPTGKVKLKIKRGGSEIVEEVELEWKTEGTPLDEFVEQNKNRPTFAGMKIPMDFDQISLAKEPMFERSFRCSGKTRIKVPKNATMIMEKPFVAYYYPTEKGNIGYLRIPHYSPREKDPRVDAYALRFSQYEYAVSELQKNTVGLIIDQDHNCGGSVRYLHQILSLFAKKQFAPTQFELLASKESYLRFKGWSEYVNEHTLAYQDVKTVADLVYKTWMETENFLTTKTSISGLKKVRPNGVKYSKPIIVLIDELSGSGGDAFPAMMQGTGRAKLLGTQTMGAGGHVISLPPLANSQITVRMTKSLFYHPNEVAIENNGASPNIQYSPTWADFVYEYQDYQKFYTEKILELVK